jgi:hypothetical protein
MSHSDSSAVEAAIFQLATSLDQYESHVAAMLDDLPESASYTAAREGIDLIRGYSSAAPALTGPSAFLLIAHTELIQAMWRPVVRPERMEELRQIHKVAVRNLRRQCLRALTARTIGILDS